MESLTEQLLSLDGRVCLICIGDRDGGDDAFGVRLGEELIDEGLSDVVIAGTEPERVVARGALGGCDHVVFVDAADFDTDPGTVVFLGSAQMVARLPPVSTHRVPLGLLAKWIESDGKTKAWFLGVQPESLERGHELSRSVREAMDQLKAELLHRVGVRVTTC